MSQSSSERKFHAAEALEPRTLLAAAPLPAEIAYDLDTRNGSGFPTTGNKIVVAGTRAFFVPDINSDFQTAGRELWVSDGTAGGTHMVKDLTPGRIGTTINDVLAVGSNALFSANVPSSPSGQVYLTDGTESGTVRLTDPTLFGLKTAGISTVARSPNGTVYFFGTNASDQAVVVRTNGTVAGTAIVATNVPGWGGSDIGLAGNRLFYQSFFSSAGWELASVDVTTGSSGMVADINPGSSVSSSPANFGTVGNKVVFFATTAASGQELWSSDGTSGGTTMVKDIVPGTSGVSSLRASATVNGAYLFMLGRDLWRSDATNGGTALVETLELATAPSFAAMASGTQRGFIYVSSQSTLISTDGTANGTFRILGPTGSPFVVSALGLPGWGDGHVFLDVTDSANGREIWTSDGSIANTRRVSDVAPGASTASSAFLAATNPQGSLSFFVATDPNIGYELWTSTTAAGSGHLVADVNQSGLSSTPEHVTAVGSKLFYERFNGSQPGLWATDTVTGTHTFLGAFEQVTAAEPRSAAFGNKLVYSGRIGTSAGVEPYVSDGTLSGTFRLGDLFPGVVGSEPTNFTELGGRMFFTAKINSSATRLFRTDGTVAGTQMVLDQQNGAMTVFGDKLYFGATGGALWRVSATGAPEQVVASGNSISYMGVSQNRLLIFRSNVSGEKLLQVCDGASPPQDVVTLPSVPKIVSSVAEVGGVTLFSYGQLWRTDFTSTGTVPIGGALVNGSDPDVYRVLNGVMIYHGVANGVAGIWRTDGTTAGTFNVKPDIFTPDELTVFAGRVYLTGGGPVDGTRRLWVTDGTTAGTTLVLNTDGITPFEPRWLQPTAKALYFAADDQDHYGRELWKIVPATAWFSGPGASWNAAANTLTVTGSATIVADPGEPAPTINLDGASASLTIAPASGAAVHLGSLNLSNNASATLASVGTGRNASNHRVLVVNSLSIDTTSKLDLADNDLIVDYTGSPGTIPATIETLVRRGFNNGDWLGKGITSSVAGAPASNGNYHLGVATNSLLVNPFGNGTTTGPLFAGQSVDSTCVLVKFTHRVDLDLNGVVDGNDAAIFNGAFSEGDGGATWMAGDVDMDGLYGSNDAAIFNSFYDESLGAI